MAELSKAEQRWLTGVRPDTEDRRPGRLLGRAQKAADRWSIEAGYIAVGLTAASPDGAPPVAPSGDRGRTVGRHLDEVEANAALGGHAIVAVL